MRDMSDVLVVDDSIAACRMVAKLLRPCGVNLSRTRCVTAKRNRPQRLPGFALVGHGAMSLCAEVGKRTFQDRSY
jgi:CheY-like chemotaxis protein